MAEEKMDIDKVKQKYEVLRKRYNLPSFEEMNNEFGIEELSEHSYTEIFARRLRVCMVDRVMNILRIIEPILNPSNAPIFIHTISKNLGNDSQKTIEGLYKEGCSIEIKSISLSICPHEEKEEVEFIRYILGKWKEINPEVKKLSESIEKAWERSEAFGDRSYLG